MFIKIPNENTVALNLYTSDLVEIIEVEGTFILRLVKKLTPQHSVRTTIQLYESYEKAFEDFEAMMHSLENGCRVWSPQNPS